MHWSVQPEDVFLIRHFSVDFSLHTDERSTDTCYNNTEQKLHLNKQLRLHQLGNFLHCALPLLCFINLYNNIYENRQ